MNCDYCHGIDSMKETLVIICEMDSPGPYFVENVPAKECRLCGDKLYDGDTIKALDMIANGEAAPVRMQSVKVFDFAMLKMERAKHDSSV